LSINATLPCSRSGPAIGGTKAAYSAQQSIKDDVALLAARFRERRFATTLGIGGLRPAARGFDRPPEGVGRPVAQ
jgi:hypothetical protein